MGRRKSGTRRYPSREINVAKLQTSLHAEQAKKQAKPAKSEIEMSKWCKNCKLAEWDHPIGGCSGFEALSLAEFAQLQEAQKAAAEKIRKDYGPTTKARPHDIEFADWIEDHLSAG